MTVTSCLLQKRKQIGVEPVFVHLRAVVVVDDGIAFERASLTVEDIRKETGYVGVRAIITGEVAKARFKTQIDIGFGDAVTPGPVDSVYPVPRSVEVSIRTFTETPMMTKRCACCGQSVRADPNLSHWGCGRNLGLPGG